MARLAQGEPLEHIPVLLDEVVKYLLQSGAGTYVDATFGRGGHSRALLASLDDTARLIAIDRDPDAVAQGLQLAACDARFQIVRGRFSQMAEIVTQVGATAVQGILMDLGVSSPQLDHARRGFSFRFSAPLDMRMDPDEGASAAQWLNIADEQDIARVLKTYADERYAKRIARAILAARPLETTDQLAEVVAAAVPHRSMPGKHPATKTFQAIRIYINQEVQELAEGLKVAFHQLAAGGRLAVISFHSIEDRAVKHAFRGLTRPPSMPRRIPIPHAQMLTLASDISGPVRPSPRELALNPRARSATLRVIEKRGVNGQG